MGGEMKFTRYEISYRHGIFCVYMRFHFGGISKNFITGGGRRISGPYLPYKQIPNKSQQRAQIYFQNGQANI